MEVSISGFEDLNQLQGFTITAMQLERMDDNTPVIRMTVISPFYEKPYEMKLFPTIDFQVRAGCRHIDAIPGIAMKGKHVEAEGGKNGKKD